MIRGYPASGERRVTVDKKLREHEWLWRSRKDDYVLLKTGESPDDLLIVQTGGGPNHGEYLLIHDDPLAQAVIAKMIEAGVPIVNDEELERRLGPE
jgi:hypothetical protein